MPVEVSGFGQPADSPIARSAGWLATGVAILMQEPVFARMLDDPFARVFAEGVLEYLEPGEIDKIFEFARAESGPGTSFVHSFTESVARGRDLATSHRRQLPGEPRRFEVAPHEIGEWHRARGHSLLELTTAQDIDRDMPKTIESPPGVPTLGVTPFMHFAVAAPQS
jgi:O-methyltransferase involved in polyketide biosynthesis